MKPNDTVRFRKDASSAALKAVGETVGIVKAAREIPGLDYPMIDVDFGEHGVVEGLTGNQLQIASPAEIAGAAVGKATTLPETTAGGQEPETSAVPGTGTLRGFMGEFRKNAAAPVQKAGKEKGDIQAAHDALAKVSKGAHCGDMSKAVEADLEKAMGKEKTALIKAAHDLCKAAGADCPVTKDDE